MPTPDLTVHIATTKTLEKWLGGTFERLPSPDGKRVGTQPLTTHAKLVSWQCHVIENHPGSGFYTLIAVEAHSRYTLLLPYAERPTAEKVWVDLVEAWIGNLTEIMWEGGFINDEQHEQVVRNFVGTDPTVGFCRNTDPSVNGHVTDAEQWVRDTLAHENLSQLTPEQAFGLGRHINQMFKTARNAHGQKERFYPVPHFLNDGLYRFGSGLAGQPFPDTGEGDFPNPYSRAEQAVPPLATTLKMGDRGMNAEDLDFLGRILRGCAHPDAIPNISALDGFLTAIASSPVPVMPSTWLPMLWGGVDFEPEWASDNELTRFFDILFNYMNRIIETLIEFPENFQPVLINDQDEPRENFGVENWCAGYTRALAAAGEAWESLPEDYMYLLGVISALGDKDLLKRLRRESPESLPELALSVPEAARELHAYNLKQRDTQAPQTSVAAPQPVRSGPKVGRNEPCPCGSGKKYKKCCLH